MIFVSILGNYCFSALLACLRCDSLFFFSGLVKLWKLRQSASMRKWRPSSSHMGRQWWGSLVTPSRPSSHTLKGCPKLSRGILSLFRLWAVIKVLKHNTFRWFGYLERLRRYEMTRRMSIQKWNGCWCDGKAPMKWEDIMLECLKGRGEEIERYEECKSKVYRQEQMKYLGIVIKHRFANWDVVKLCAPL